MHFLRKILCSVCTPGEDSQFNFKNQDFPDGKLGQMFV